MRADYPQRAGLRYAARSSRAWAGRGLVVARSAQHAHDLRDQLLTLDRLDCGDGRPLADPLYDPEVALGQRGDLRQVRDAHDLAGGGEVAQTLADGASRGTAHAGVDLVEHQSPRSPARPAERPRAPA